MSPEKYSTTNTGNNSQMGPVERRREIKKRKIRNYLMSKTLWLILYAAGADTEDVTGRLHGTIIGHEIAHPDAASDRLIYRKPEHGLWTSYDFLRSATFKKANRRRRVKKICDGSVRGFLLDEIRDNNSDDLTPVGLFDITNLEHMSQFDNYTLERLVDDGLARHTTHEEAYAKVGLLDRYERELKIIGMLEQPVFQVTPKGSTLVFISRERGDKKPREEREGAQEWTLLPGMPRPAYAPVKT